MFIVQYEKCALQEALRSGKHTLETLASDLALNIYRHPELPLVGFKYHQLDSPKSDPIVREARGIVLEEGTWNIVAKGFNRFFNVGEFQDEFAQFDWSNFSCASKEDGSLILLYHYNNEWHVNASGSFAFQNIGTSGISFQEMFWKTSGLMPDDLEGLEGNTLVFELCTQYNKVVRTYKKPVVYLLSSFCIEEDRYGEDSPEGVDAIHKKMAHRNVLRPESYDFKSMDEIKTFLLRQEEKDMTFEGVVLRDIQNRRYKWKTSTYVSLHHLHDNGNILLPSRLVPIVLAGEVSEVLVTKPEVTTALLDVQATLDQAYSHMADLWRRSKDLPTQKDYAIAVKDHLAKGILFAMRKYHHPNGTEKDLQTLWRNAGDFLAKTFFEGKTYEFDILEVDEAG